MDILILEDVGWGYSKLAVVLNAAIKKLGLDNNYEIIGNPRFFQRFNVSRSPALLIDGEIVIEGYVPTLEEMINLLTFIPNP